MDITNGFYIDKSLDEALPIFRAFGYYLRRPTFLSNRNHEIRILRDCWTEHAVYGRGVEDCLAQWFPGFAPVFKGYTPEDMSDETKALIRGLLTGEDESPSVRMDNWSRAVHLAVESFRLKTQPHDFSLILFPMEDRVFGLTSGPSFYARRFFAECPVVKCFYSDNKKRSKNISEETWLANKTMWEEVLSKYPGLDGLSYRLISESLLSTRRNDTDGVNILLNKDPEPFVRSVAEAMVIMDFKGRYTENGEDKESALTHAIVSRDMIDAETFAVYLGKAEAAIPRSWETLVEGLPKK